MMIDMKLLLFSSRWVCRMLSFFQKISKDLAPYLWLLSRLNCFIPKTHCFMREEKVETVGARVRGSSFSLSQG